MPRTPRFIFRTDSSTSIGYGHVMRCMTLADALTTAGCHCSFISRGEDGNINSHVEERGYEITVLPITLPEGEFNDGAEAAIVAGLVSKAGADWLVVDHYQIESNWESQVRGASNLRLLVIDDIADRKHNCDVLLDQNYGREKSHYRGLLPNNSATLVGLPYALLRPEFPRFRRESLSRQKQGKLNHLLITMGGTDELNMTAQVLNSLATCKDIEKLEVSVVLGQTSKWIDSVNELSTRLPFAVNLHVGVRNMAELMSQVDFAIGACGSTTWERCCLGLPSLLFVLAKNQERICNDLSADGIVVKGDMNFIDDSVSQFLCFIQNNENREKIVCKSSSLVDGAGVGRVTAVLLEGKSTGHED